MSSYQFSSQQQKRRRSENEDSRKRMKIDKKLNINHFQNETEYISNLKKVNFQIGNKIII